jgi:hypothetical protein
MDESGSATMRSLGQHPLSAPIGGGNSWAWSRPEAPEDEPDPAVKINSSDEIVFDGNKVFDKKTGKKYEVLNIPGAGALLLDDTGGLFSASEPPQPGQKLSPAEQKVKDLEEKLREREILKLREKTRDHSSDLINKDLNLDIYRSKPPLKPDIINAGLDDRGISLEPNPFSQPIDHLTRPLDTIDFPLNGIKVTDKKTGTQYDYRNGKLDPAVSLRSPGEPDKKLSPLEQRAKHLEEMLRKQEIREHLYHLEDELRMRTSFTSLD